MCCTFWPLVVGMIWAILFISQTKAHAHHKHGRMTQHKQYMKISTGTYIYCIYLYYHTVTNNTVLLLLCVFNVELWQWCGYRGENATCSNSYGGTNTPGVSVSGKKRCVYNKYQTRCNGVTCDWPQKICSDDRSALNLVKGITWLWYCSHVVITTVLVQWRLMPWLAACNGYDFSKNACVYSF